jgi:hypothetical protein
VNNHSSLPCEYEVLTSNPTTSKKKKKRRRKEKEETEKKEKVLYVQHYPSSLPSFFFLSFVL